MCCHHGNGAGKHGSGAVIGSIAPGGSNRVADWPYAREAGRSRLRRCCTAFEMLVQRNFLRTTLDFEPQYRWLDGRI